MEHIFNNKSGQSFLYHISGATKMLAFLALTFASIFSYDIRFIGGLLLFSVALIAHSRIAFRRILPLLIYAVIFLIINALLTFVFAPEYGVSIYGTRHVIATLFGRYIITQEQILYQATKFCKYLSVIPIGILFLFTTNPSEFAASLNRLRIPYKIAYALSLTLRYFPDLVNDYRTIATAQQARGLEIGKKSPLFKRLKHAAFTIIPLIFSTMDRIDTIANAMDLRGFAKKKRRSWYSAQRMRRTDYLTLAVSFAILAVSMCFNIFINNGSRFYNPFG